MLLHCSCFHVLNGHRDVLKSALQYLVESGQKPPLLSEVPHAVCIFAVSLVRDYELVG